MTSVRTSQGRADAKSTFGEVEAVARRSSYTVELDPLHVLLADSALQHQVLNQAPYRVVDQRRDNGCLHVKAAL
jgi:hypothetical protein